MRSDRFLLLLLVTFCALVWSAAWGWLPTNYWTFPRCLALWLVGYLLIGLNTRVYWRVTAWRIRRALRRIGMGEEEVERQVKHWVTDRKKPR